MYDAVLRPAAFTVRRFASDCQGKERFDAYALAREVARNMRRGGKRGCFPYRCEHCHRWHVGGGRKGRRTW